MRFSPLIFLIFASLLIARDNPFEPTQTYQEEIARMMELEDGHPLKIVNEEVTSETLDAEENLSHEDVSMAREDNNSMQEIPMAEMINSDTNINNTTKASQENNQTVDKVVQAPNMSINTNSESMTKTTEKIAMKSENTYPYLEKDFHKLLPFLTIEFNNNAFEIKSKYKVFKKFNLENEKKIILDFRADVNFYTKRNNLNSENFKQLIIGNHKSENYFRIVLIVEQNPNDYKVTYNDSGLRVEKP